jgi:hypothetical protein
MFVEKSLEEISKMTLEEQTAYQQAKKSHEAEQLKAQIEEATKNSASKEDIEALTKKNADVIKEIERLGLELKKLNETPKTAEKGFKSVGEAIKHAVRVKIVPYPENIFAVWVMIATRFKQSSHQ